MNEANAQMWANMQTEVKEVNTKLGWWDKPVSLTTALALLASEVCEALQAWRDWGFDDPNLTKCDGKCLEIPHNPAGHKPEGVGSELADIVIRLLDDAERFELDLRPFWGEEACSQYTYVAEMELPDQVFDMLFEIMKAGEAWVLIDPIGMEHRLGKLLLHVQRLAEANGIDLMAEYRRKLEYNKTRPYRHGRKV